MRKEREQYITRAADMNGNMMVVGDLVQYGRDPVSLGFPEHCRTIERIARIYRLAGVDYIRVAGKDRRSTYSDMPACKHTRME